jgi:Uma2 family endonuclease
MSTIPIHMPSPFAPVLPAVLPLEPGDHMLRDEFERRYDAMPDGVKCELLDGVVYMPPPASGGFHAEPQFNFVAFLGTYAWSTPGVRGGDNASLRLDMKSMPQPDAYLAIEPSYGGRIRHDEKGIVIGAPDLIGEISASSVSYDLHIKKEIYRRNDVKEYVVWRTKEHAIDWFILRGEQYEPLPMAAGVYRSELFPGLWLAATALIASDFATVKRALEQGLASPEHGAFVEQLQRQKSP